MACVTCFEHFVSFLLLKSLGLSPFARPLTCWGNWTDLCSWKFPFALYFFALNGCILYYFVVVLAGSGDPKMILHAAPWIGQAGEAQALLKDSQRLLDEQDTMLRLANSERQEAIRRLQCKICMENPCELLLLPCQHLCICKSCFAGIEHAANQSDPVACPTCRTPVQATAKTLLT